MNTTESTPFIIVKNLTIAYDNCPIVSNIDFRINRGDIFMIMGPSGCGKSTLMKSLIGLLRPQSGQILINGTDLWGISDSERVNTLKTFGISFQSGALFSSMTVAENIALPIELQTNMSQKEILNRVTELLAVVGLENAADLIPTEISGGMIKRVALARALALNPQALFFDEPSAGLDPIRSKQLDDLIYKINKMYGTTIIMVTHELDSIESIATNSIYLDNITHGIGARGMPADILETTNNKTIIEFLTRGNTRGKKCKK
ncbi:MAG: ATP-binding cassette domain-containing protein [Alphaproteobacteria bacterium]|nr:ATP-binding cassette domain-containing protein [Alphaproteobacteria bacterium]